MPSDTRVRREILLLGPLIAFDGLDAAVVVVCVAAVLFAVWAAYDIPRLWDLLAVVFLIVALSALVAGLDNLLLWYVAWEIAVFVVWGLGRWAGLGAQTILGPLPLHGLGALGSLGMIGAILMLALQNRSLAVRGLEIADQNVFVVLLLSAILLKGFALLSPAWYETRDGRSFFVAQSVVGAAGLLIVGVQPYLRFLYSNAAHLSEWRNPVFLLGLGIAFLAGLAALGETDLPRAMAYVLYSQFAGLLARFAWLQPADTSLVVIDLVVYALSVIALGLCIGHVYRSADERDLRRMATAPVRNTGVAVVYLLSSLALAGWPPFAGFTAGVFQNTGAIAGGDALAAAFLVALGALTLLVLLRVFRLIFMAEPLAQWSFLGFVMTGLAVTGAPPAKPLRRTLGGSPHYSRSRSGLRSSPCFFLSAFSRKTCWRRSLRASRNPSSMSSLRSVASLHRC